VPDRPLRCAGALIVDGEGRIFVQRRSADLSLFPGAWDLVGGHLEPGESALDAVRREVYEETGWTVSTVFGVSGDYTYLGNDGRPRSEVDFLVGVAGAPEPTLEDGVHTEYRWLAEGELPLLAGEAEKDGGLGVRVMTDAFAAVRRLTRAAEPVDVGPVAFAGLVAPAVDRAFVGAMATAGQHSAPILAERYGSGAGAVLVEFRTSLAEPGRTVAADEIAAVARYRDLDRLRAVIARQVSAGRLDADADGGISATPAGRAFLADIRALQAEALPPAWQDPWLAETVGRVLDAAIAEAGPALRAMAPVYEPPDCPPAVVLLNRLGTLRYHRSDAHAAAWHAAGLDAAEIQALAPGPQRAGIEEETNLRNGPPWTAIPAADRVRLLAGLAALPT